jgi:hypothetical protein
MWSHQLVCHFHHIWLLNKSYHHWQQIKWIDNLKPNPLAKVLQQYICLTHRPNSSVEDTITWKWTATHTYTLQGIITNERADLEASDDPNLEVFLVVGYSWQMPYDRQSCKEEMATQSYLPIMQGPQWNCPSPTDALLLQLWGLKTYAHTLQTTCYPQPRL